MYLRSRCLTIPHIAPSLRLFVPNSPSMCYRSFFSGVCTCDVTPSCKLSCFHSCGGCYITATTAASLRLLVPSSTLISCEPVQVYYHHPRPRVSLGPIYHSIYPGDSIFPYTPLYIPYTEKYLIKLCLFQ
jgi:hypothetical protein